MLVGFAGGMGRGCATDGRADPRMGGKPAAPWGGQKKEGNLFCHSLLTPTGSNSSARGETPGDSVPAPRIDPEGVERLSVRTNDLHPFRVRVPFLPLVDDTFLLPFGLSPGWVFREKGVTFIFPTQFLLRIGPKEIIPLLLQNNWTMAAHQRKLPR